MSSAPRRPAGAIASLLFALGLALPGCENLPTASQDARLSILLTDAAGELDEAWVEISGIYLQGQTDAPEQKVWLLNGSTGMIDLLTLNGTTAPLVDDAAVPPGVYSQLRLIVAAAVIKTTAGTVHATPGAAHPDGLPSDGPLLCPSCGQTGFKVNLPGGALTLDGEPQTLVIDFDVSQTFGRAAGASGGWVMHPVLNASDFAMSGTIAGSVRTAAGMDLGACGAALTDFIPLARNGDHEKSGRVNADGSYRISFVEPGDYVLDYAATITTGQGTLTFSATANPASVAVQPGSTETADYTITGCQGASQPFAWQPLGADGAFPGNVRLSPSYSQAENVIYACAIAGDFQPASLWKFDLSAGSWSEIPTSGWPSGKFRKCVHDPAAGTMLTYWDGIGRVYEVSTSGGAWNAIGFDTDRSLYENGTPFLDPVSGELTHFGGYGFFNYRNALWQFNRSRNQWIQLSQTNPPDGRYGPPVAVDVANGRAFFAGRSRGPLGVADDLWILDLRAKAWTNLIPAGAANALDRFNSGLAYVPGEDALYRFAGRDLTLGGYSAALMRLELGASALAYEPVAPGGPMPGARFAPSLFYDSARQRLILVGGRDGVHFFSDVWALPLP